MKTSKRKIIPYAYYIHPIGENGQAAYKAIIPAFNNAIVYGGNLQELEKGIRFTIESEIIDRKKQGKSIPSPDQDSKFSGKILVRISPLLHEKIALEAKASGKSLNKYIEEQLIS